MKRIPKIWCVRANGGQYIEQFKSGSYVGVGWCEIAESLEAIASRDDLYKVVQATYSNESPYVIGNYVGQLSRFLMEMQPDDFVITPDLDTDWLCYATVSADPSYFYGDTKDRCPYLHRRKVVWSEDRLKRGEFSVPLQNTLRSSLSVFGISQREEFLAAIGQPIPGLDASIRKYDSYQVVLDQVLELEAREFEILVGHLLTALGFEGSEVVGKSGDGGVDATGELNVANLAKVKVFVQAKRYKTGSKIAANVVRQLRQAIPFGGQGAFITTADFQSAATDVALEPGFPRIGLINGRQLVDLLIEHWEDIPSEFRERLGLKQGLVRV